MAHSNSLVVGGILMSSAQARIPEFTLLQSGQA